MNNIKMSVEPFVEEISGTVKLERWHPSGTGKTWVVVEGLTDQKLFSRLLDHQNVVIKISHCGVTGVLTIVETLRKEEVNILGIRDADFLHLEQTEEIPENIFLTDYHDAEMMMASSDDTLNTVGVEYSINSSLPELRQKILESLSFLGGIRWVNYTEKVGLNFDKVDIRLFCDKQRQVIDKEACLSHINKRSRNKTREITKTDVLAKIKDFSQKMPDLLNLCNGHDFQKAFAHYVNQNKEKAKAKEKSINPEEIGKIFRSAYTQSEFRKTALYKNLQEFSVQKALPLFKSS